MGVESADVDIARRDVSNSGRHELAPGSRGPTCWETNKDRKDVEDPDAGGVISGMPSNGQPHLQGTPHGPAHVLCSGLRRVGVTSSVWGPEVRTVVCLLQRKSDRGKGPWPGGGQEQGHAGRLSADLG